MPTPPALPFCLLPQPRQCEWTGRTFAWDADGWDAGGDDPLAQLRSAGGEATIDPAFDCPAQGYRLTLAAGGIVLTAPDAAGLFYGAMTLRQIVRLLGGIGWLPEGTIRDWPDLAMRGVMLDISRDKVPTMATLLRLIDLLAEWKINQFQLYLEHTFTYAGHEAVWQEASPMTGGELRALDRACRKRHIELVPNQNSFGHMERWLKHDRYAPLAEDPARRLTLCPLDPGSLALMRDLYGQLVPHFQSRLLNIGCDETWELGEGRSREACQARGKGRVYLDYLLALCAEARGLGRTPMFWGDIILKYPELIAELPRDAVALLWGYEADQPRDEDARRFAEAGVPFVVCPGASGWNSLTGRAEAWRPNILRAARLAREQGALGMLVTEWGDNGHWQQYPTPLPGLAWAAALGWCAASNETLDLGEALGRHVFEDPTGRAGHALIALEEAQGRAGLRIFNNSPLFTVLSKPDQPLPEGLDEAALDRIEAGLTQAENELAPAAMRCEDAVTIDAELRQGIAWARLAIGVVRARRAAGGILAGIAGPERQRLATLAHAGVEQQWRLWLTRNRLGGLEESQRRFEPLLAALGTQAGAFRPYRRAQDRPHGQGYPRE